MRRDPDICRIADECIASRMRLLNRVITGLYDEALRPYGLTISQMNLLVLAHRQGVARPAEVCERLCMDASTLSRNVRRMLERGWIETLSEADSRARPFRVTDEGQALLRDARAGWEQAQARAKELLGPRAEAALLTAAASVQSGAARGGDPGGSG
jgi:DNA-binding MarR family transcriptional regulator